MNASPNLHTTVAETLVAGERSDVFAAVVELVAGLWPGMTEVVLLEPPARLVHSVSTAGDEIDGWVTWELTPGSS